MLRILLISACLAVPVLSNSAGAPSAICKNGLTPEHGLAGQSSPVPYSFSSDKTSLAAGDSLNIKLGGDNFLGFAVQMRTSTDPDNSKVLGKFQVVDSKYSQTLSCSSSDDTITHKKVNKEEPLKSIELKWIAPEGYKGKAVLVGTVVKDGGTFWIRKVLKEVQIN